MNQLLQVGLNMSIAMSLGALIGLERQWRQRMAGLRTNALVALGASAFVAIFAPADHPQEMARVAAQVVSGIGFLGAGVIMRDGVSVRGLNTAATLWCAAGIGVVSGIGLHAQAAIGTILVIAVNLLLRPIAQRLNHVSAPQAEEELRYQIRVVCREREESHIRFLVLQATGGSDLCLRAIESNGIPDCPRVEVIADIETQGRRDSTIEQVVSRLSLERGVSSVRWVLSQQGVIAA